MKIIVRCAMTMLAANAAWAASLAVSDFSFENYRVGAGALAYQYSTNPSFVTNYVAGWTFDPAAGIAASGSDFNTPAPVQGNQVGFLQSNGATISQSIGGFDSSFIFALDIWVGTRYASGSYDGNAGVNFLIDGVPVGTTGSLPSFQPFAEYIIPFKVSTSGAHTVALVNFSAAGDHTAFVDAVSISSTAPEPATFGLFGAALVALGIVRRRA